MTAHQQKKLDVEALLRVPRPLRAAADRRRRRSAALLQARPTTAPRCATCERAARARRRAAGAAQRLRAARSAAARRLLPRSRSQADGKEMSTTMAFVRLLGKLLKDTTLGPRIVPIVADEARTFGMASLFRQIGIYSPVGQLYEPEDAGSMLYYREAKDGQILEEGITEAGAMSSWIAAATVVQRARPADAAVLHLLLDVRLPARRRPDLGRGRPARARLPARRDRRPHHARRRRPAAPGRHAATWSRRRCRTAAPTIPAFACELAVIVDDGMRAHAGARRRTCSTTSR